MSNASETLLDAVAASLRSAATAFHAGVEEPPVAVLWTDPDGSWQPVAEQLRGLMPELLVLGRYNPAKRTGPVIWLKCAIAGKIAEVTCDDGVTLVLYLPGVSRYQLRNADQCPVELQPLVELLYRGTVWTHRNGRDWTLEAFFQSEDGLGLDVASDDSTKLSLRSALSALARTPLAQLRGKGRLNAAAFDAVVVGDTPRDLLTWIGSPEAVQKEWGEERWFAFRSRCRDEFGFDPETEPPIFAAEKLGLRESERWIRLWDRFCEAPALFGGVREALDRAQPTDLLALEPETWPGENAKAEDALRSALVALADKPPHVARQTLSTLEKEHGVRRGWIWARMGEAQLAMALRSLHALAEATRTVPAFDAPEVMEQWYRDTGWEVDAAVLSALQATKNARDEAAVHTTIRSVYAPWLEDVAERYQELVAGAGYRAPGGESAEPGECLLFVDGLRLDVGHVLMQALSEAGLPASLSTRLAALPTVTPCAKPAVSPVGQSCGGARMPVDFRPETSAGEAVSPHAFAKLLEAAGYQRLTESEVLEPATAEAKGWMESGRIDSRGHDLGIELAAIIPAELQRVVTLVEALLEAGWRQVRIITDHGWLLMPGGLTKHELPGFLVESRWARCAAIKGQSTPDIQTVPWHWNSAESVGIAPGARVFLGGNAYAHGGVSPQECVTPVIRVQAGSEPGRAVTRIGRVQWKRMRCSLEIESEESGLRADMRLTPGDAKSSVLAAVKEVEGDGQVSVLVEDPDLVGRTATIVIINASGSILAKSETRIGG